MGRLCSPPFQVSSYTQKHTEFKWRLWRVSEDFFFLIIIFISLTLLFLLGRANLCVRLHLLIFLKDILIMLQNKQKKDWKDRRKTPQTAHCFALLNLFGLNFYHPKHWVSRGKCLHCSRDWRWFGFPWGARRSHQLCIMLLLFAWWEIFPGIRLFWGFYSCSSSCRDQGSWEAEPARSEQVHIMGSTMEFALITL